MNAATPYEQISLAAEIGRDRFGRPMVTPPGGGKPVPYTRATTVAGALEDYYNLGEWEKRMVAVGLARRPDLLMAVTGAGAQPNRRTDPDGYKRWRKIMDTTTAAAKEAAAASASATIGTALHALTERIDRGQELGVVPDTYLPHLAAYQDATSEFEAVHIERFTVEDQFRIGGTPDRILRIPGHDKLIIGDIKTGDTEFGVGKMCMQLAIYAHSYLYDIPTGTRTPIGDIDQTVGLIIALDAQGDPSTGPLCTLKWIDLAAGWEAVQTAITVRGWRSRKQFFVEPPNTRPTLGVEADIALRHAIDKATTPDELVQLWQAAGLRWTDEHTALASARKSDLQVSVRASASTAN